MWRVGAKGRLQWDLRDERVDPYDTFDGSHFDSGFTAPAPGESEPGVGTTFTLTISHGLGNGQI